MPSHLFRPLVLSLAIAAAPATAKEVMKIHLDLTQDSAPYLGLKEFERLVEERTQGAIDVEIYPNNALGDDVEAAQQIQFGAIHGAPIPTAALSTFNPSLQLIDLPFIFPSAKIAHEALDSAEVGGRLLEGMAASGFVGATFFENGFKQLTCNHPIHEPSDYQGRKVRVMQSPLLIAQFEAVGATAIPIAFSELYGALQQGVVECQENPLQTINAMKFYEVQDYLTLSNHGYLGTVFVFSKVWYEAQSPETQDILMKSAHDAAVFERKAAGEFNDRILGEIRAEGSTEIIELTQQQREDFLAAMKPVHAKFADEIGPDLIQATYDKVQSLSSN
ncbi:MAG: TRAP transporter substrate-binding protein [Jhaorihella sp.]